MTPTPSELPSLSVSDISVIESEAGAMLRFEIKASRSDFVEPITFNYATEGLSAEPGVDFESTSGSGTINVGSTETLVEVTVMDDDILEVEETLQIVLTQFIQCHSRQNGGNRDYHRW